jgi:hypothetical protein
MKMYNENYVNCWKATVILITMLISIQAITGVVEGSETNQYGLEQAMNGHERIAPQKGDDIVRTLGKLKDVVYKLNHGNKIDVSTDFELMGFTGNEKTINRIGETYEKEAKFPRVVVFEKTLRKGLNVVFDLSNYNENLIPVFTQGTKIDLGTGTGTQISHGTVEPVKEYRTIRFAATLEDNTRLVNLLLVVNLNLYYLLQLKRCTMRTLTLLEASI